MPKLFKENVLYEQSYSGRVYPTNSKCGNDVPAGWEHIGITQRGFIMSFSQSGRYIYEHNTWRKFGLFE